MGRREAEALIRRKTASLLNVRAEAGRSELYGLLEEYRVGSGIRYSGAKNPSSVGGDPPARQSGRLMESVKVLKRATPDSLVSSYGPDPKAFPKSPYPVYLQKGTRYMRARPFANVALERFKAKIRSGS